MPEGKLPKEVQTKDSALDRARRRRSFLKACPFEKKYRERKIKDIKYFTGEDQGWDEHGDRARLIEKKRPAVTLNRMNPIWRLIEGNRLKSETKFIGVEDNDVQTAPVFNASKDHIERNNRWEFQENEWFKRGGIALRSVLEIFRDFSKDPRSDVGLRLHDGADCYFDPDGKEKDRSDGRDMLIEKMIPPDEAKKLWPQYTDKIDQLAKAAADSKTNDGEGEVEHDTQAVDEYKDPKSSYYDQETKKISVNYYWYKETEQKVSILDFSQGDVDPVSGAFIPKVYTSKKNYYDTKEAVKQFGDQYQVLVHDSKRVRYIVFCHEMKLEEGGHPFERDDGQPTTLSQNFPFICFEPDRIFSGTYDELISIFDPQKDPQTYHNKLASAIIEIIGTAAQSGVDYEQGSFASPDDEKSFKKNDSKPGHNQRWAKNALAQGRVKRRQPSNPPVAHMSVAKEMAEAQLDISGIEGLINPSAYGSNASGYRTDLGQRQGISVVSWIYESFRFFKHVLAEYIRDAIQATYTYEKIIRITGDKQRKQVRINERVYDYQGAIQEILNNVTIGTYDVTVSDKPLTPTMRVERFQEFVKLVQTGALQIPPEVMTAVVLHLMDDADLKEIVEQEMEQLAQIAQQQEQQPRKAKRKIETTEELKDSEDVDGGKAELMTKRVTTEEIEGSPEAIAA